MTYKIGLHHETEREMDLLPHEVEARKNEVLGLLKQRENVRLEKQLKMKGFNDRLKGLDESIERTRAAIEHKREVRKLTVVWRNMGDRAQLFDVADLEMSRPLEQRPLEEHETQVEMFGQEGQTDDQAHDDRDEGDHPEATREGAGDRDGSSAQPVHEEQGGEEGDRRGSPKKLSSVDRRQAKINAEIEAGVDTQSNAHLFAQAAAEGEIIDQRSSALFDDEDDDDDADDDEEDEEPEEEEEPARPRKSPKNRGAR